MQNLLPSELSGTLQGRHPISVYARYMMYIRACHIAISGYCFNLNRLWVYLRHTLPSMCLTRAICPDKA